VGGSVPDTEPLLRDLWFSERYRLKTVSWWDVTLCCRVFGHRPSAVTVSSGTGRTEIDLVEAYVPKLTASHTRIFST
jgi:hypothetical protein